MRNIAQFLRNISLTLHQLAHFKQNLLSANHTLTHANQTATKLSTNKGVAHGRVPNQLTYQRPREETCASQSPSDGLAKTAFYTRLASVTH